MHVLNECIRQVVDVAATQLQRSKVEPAFLGFLPQHVVPWRAGLRALVLGSGS